ncbi:hypothetical protein DIPPA_34761 [Diplonema papillatum]|nr:hypothetical protein DIPPA_34761 [Diplonema papillatum]
MPHIRRTIWKKATESISDFVNVCASQKSEKLSQTEAWYGIAKGAEEKEFNLLPDTAVKELEIARKELPEAECSRMGRRQPDVTMDSRYRAPASRRRRKSKNKDAEVTETSEESAPKVDLAENDEAPTPSLLQKFAWNVYTHLRKHNVREGRWLICVPEAKLAPLVEALVAAQEDGTLPSTAIDFKAISGTNFLVGVYTENYGDAKVMSKTRSVLLGITSKLDVEAQMTYKLVGVAQLENEWDTSMKFMLRDTVVPRENAGATELEWLWLRQAWAPPDRTFPAL